MIEEILAFFTDKTDFIWQWLIASVVGLAGEAKCNVALFKRQAVSLAEVLHVVHLQSLSLDKCKMRLTSCWHWQWGTCKVSLAAALAFCLFLHETQYVCFDRYSPVRAMWWTTVAPKIDGATFMLMFSLADSRPHKLCCCMHITS